MASRVMMILPKNASTEKFLLVISLMHQLDNMGMACRLREVICGVTKEVCKHCDLNLYRGLNLI